MYRTEIMASYFTDGTGVPFSKARTKTLSKHSWATSDGFLARVVDMAFV
tara:strand:- start:115 stop:261 length:147 start_codon:yes stop_codon:yes gene_type:complete